MPPTPSTVSFTVRRPTPVSRPSSSGPESDGPFKIPALPRHLTSAATSATASPLAGSPRTLSRENSDDEGEAGIVFANGSGADEAGHHTESSDEDNLVARSKRPARQRFQLGKQKPLVPEAPLVIPSKPNPDWREAARRRRAACSRVQSHTFRAAPSFVPDSARASTGADGSVGGLGTRDTINSHTQLSGLQIRKKVEMEVEEEGAAMMGVVSTVSMEQSMAEVVEETEDEKALRAILAGGEDESAPVVEIIPVPPLSEADALKQDVQGLPDVATAEDYERVPIAAFGAAMLRGMGWTDGGVAPKSDKRRKNALMELYLPQARPALLGIGAKERELVDDGSGKKKSKRPDMRYIPVTKKEGGRGEDGSSRSGTVSRRSSRSPPRRERDDRGADQEKSAYDDRERRSERERDHERGEGSRQRTKDHDGRARDGKDYRDRNRDRDWDRDQDAERDRTRGRSDAHRDSERERKGRQYDERERTRERDKRDRRDDR